MRIAAQQRNRINRVMNFIRNSDAEQLDSAEEDLLGNNRLEFDVQQTSYEEEEIGEDLGVLAIAAVLVVAVEERALGQTETDREPVTEGPIQAEGEPMVGLARTEGRGELGEIPRRGYLPRR